MVKRVEEEQAVREEGIAPRLTIEAYEDAKRPLSIHDLSIRLDGKPVKGLVGLSLNLEVDEANQCTITFYPGPIEVDAEVLQWLEAQVKREEGDV